MSLVKFVKEITSWEEFKKFYLKIFVAILLLLLGIFCINYSIFKEKKINLIQAQSNIIQLSIENSLHIYKELLSAIGYKVRDDEMANLSKVQYFLKQFYLTENGDQRIPFTDIIWNDRIKGVSVSKYGVQESNISIAKEIEGKLQNTFGQIFIAKINNNFSLSGHDKVYVLMGVHNDKKQYIGYLSLLIDLESWISKHKENLQEKGLAVTIINQDNVIKFASDSSIENFMLNSNQISYKFDSINNISTSLYSFAVGYNNKLFWKELARRLWPQFLVLIFAYLSAIMFFILFKKKVYKYYHAQAESELKSLSRRNLKYHIELEKLNIGFKQKEEALENKLKDLEGALYAYTISHSEREQLLSVINKNISNSLFAIKDLIQEFYDIQNDSSVINLKNSNAQDIISEIQIRLNYLPYFCLIKNDLVDIEKSIQSIVTIYSKEIYKKNLKFSYEIASKIKSLNFDSFLFVQILSSLAYISIDSAKANGKIIFEVSKEGSLEGEFIKVIIKDNGFYLDKDVNTLFHNDDNNKITCPLRLDLNTFKTILENEGCYFSTSYNKDIKIQVLQFPCNPHRTKDIKIADFVGSNVIKLKNTKK